MPMKCHNCTAEMSWSPRLERYWCVACTNAIDLSEPPAPPAAEPDAAESPLGISADIGRLKTVSRFGGDLPPQIVFSDGEEYHRTLERVASHLLAMLPAPADVKGGDS